MTRIAASLMTTRCGKPRPGRRSRCAASGVRFCPSISSSRAKARTGTSRTPASTTISAPAMATIASGCCATPGGAVHEGRAAGSLARRELVAEGTGRRALHDGLGTLEANLASADRRDVEISLAYQQRAELGFAQRTEEFGEAAARDIDIERLFVLAQDLGFDLPSGDFAEDALDGRPFAPRAALDAIANCGKQLFRPVAQGLFHNGVGLVLSQLGPQRAQHRHQDLSLDPRLVQER